MARRRSAPHPPSEPIRLVVVEPRTILGLGVREVLDREADIEVVAQVRSPAEALSVVDEASPDVILVSGVPAEEPAAEATRRLRRRTPRSALVVLGGEDDDASIVGAVGIGADAHVAEIAEPAELVATIRRVAEGGDPLEDELIARSDLVERILDEFREAIRTDREPTNLLTARELEVLRLVAAGQHNRQIAETLGISEQTVKNHLSNVMHKLGVPNRTRAVMYAARQGWIVLDEIPDEAAIEPRPG